jgi:NAD/NADP transhydrogenase beta subunit
VNAVWFLAIAALATPDLTPTSCSGRSIVIGLSLVLGVLRDRGADMPVVISLLNSYSARGDDGIRNPQRRTDHRGGAGRLLSIILSQIM